MRKIKSLICFYSSLAVLGLTLTATADVIDIPDDYPAIQAGIYVANDYDTILVQPGIYLEHINFLSKDIVVGSLFLTTGDTSHISSTIITGDEERVSVVNFTSGETNYARLVGFTISNYPAGLDGGIYCENSEPTIANNYIINNRSLRSGAGIQCSSAGPIIEGNLICGNRAGYLTELGNGGGIYCDSESSPVINENVIKGNRAFGGGGIACSNQSHPEINKNQITNNSADIGGAIYLYSNSNPSISQNIIQANSVDWWGGGVYCNRSSPLLEFNVITGNISSKEAGGLLMHDSNANLHNNTISGNLAEDSAGGIWISQSNLIIVNNIIWGNNASWYDELFLSGLEPEITYTDIAGGWEGEGNIDSDPMFVDQSNSDFNLRPGSPCIDAGDPDFPLDPDGSRCDMGACFHEHSMVIDDDPALPADKSLIWNYPNPFNLSTTIICSLPKSSRVKINIYDIEGRLVESLDDSFRLAGIYRFEWYPGALSSGIYFVRLSTGRHRQTAKMVLLK